MVLIHESISLVEITKYILLNSYGRLNMWVGKQIFGLNLNTISNKGIKYTTQNLEMFGVDYFPWDEASSLISDNNKKCQIMLHEIKRSS